MAYDGKAFDSFYSVFVEFNEALFAHLSNLLPGRPAQVLDLCSGTGISTRAIAKTFPDAQVVGIDISSNLVSRALSTFVPPNVRYETGSYLEAGKGGRVFDLVVVKSAFHLLKEAGVGLPDLMKLVDDHGYLAVFETTGVCVESYGLFDAATRIWKEQVSQAERDELVLSVHRSLNLQIIVSRFGQTVEFPPDVYAEGVRSKQISCLWQFGDEIIADFLDRKKGPSQTGRLFEDYDIILIRKSKGSGRQ